MRNGLQLGFVVIVFLAIPLVGFSQGSLAEYVGALGSSPGISIQAYQDSGVPARADEEERLPVYRTRIRNLEQDILERNNTRLRKEIDMLRAELSGVYHELGNIYVQQKLYPEAIDAYQKSLRYDPANFKNYYHLGLLYEFSQDDTQQALLYLTKYLESNPPEQEKKKTQGLIKMLQGGQVREDSR